MRKTIKLLFSGKVQNVGFRTYMKNVGQNLGLCGEVENLPDGRVRALVTGEDMVIEKFLSMVYTVSACDYPRGCSVGVCDDGTPRFYGEAQVRGI
ncbi:MAG TPA: acylphosphatase [Methanocorpusculum sp.]|nr:acylphosphatase [Methanocorpusculum sp.]